MSKYDEIKANSRLISFGNTGARLSDPRATYASILKALEKFRASNRNWDTKDQVEFGRILGDEGIFNINTTNIVGADKDVRVKTGFISQLGFTTEKRIITNVGKEILSISTASSTNEFQISDDSFIYLKQFLKYQQNDFEVLPLLSLIYAIIDFDNELPINFVTYIWAASQTENKIIQDINAYKLNSNFKLLVYKSLLNTENAIKAKENIKDFFDMHKVSNKNEIKELLYSILPHGKGNTFKDKAIALFHDLHSYWINKNKFTKFKKRRYILEKIKPRHKDISSKKPKDYLEALFGTSNFNKATDWDKVILFFEDTELISAKDEESFVLQFHLLYMFIKKLSICEEYRDLNIRHLKLLDIFIFEHDKIKLDLLFWYLFKSVKRELLKVKPLPQDGYIVNLEANQKKLGDIYSFLSISAAKLSAQIEADFPDVKELGLKKFVLRKKEERLLNLVNRVFTKENIIAIFTYLNPRNDQKVRDLIKGWYQEYDATIPALFEYLLGISFYWLSHKLVKISDVLNLNLDANLLPKTHAAGGGADMIVHIQSKAYLIEATLSDSDKQRQMEAEPVPRHLANYILDENPNSMALFIAGKFDPNNLVVLRNYKFSPWYNPDGRRIDSMDILPLSVSNIIYLLKTGVDFKTLENRFELVLNSDTKDGFNWYNNEVNPMFSE